MVESALVSERASVDLEAFFERNVERAHRLAWRLVGGDDMAAEDIVQDAFAKALRGLPGFRGGSSLDTWFYRIVVREAQSFRRWRSVRRRWNVALGDDVPAPRVEGPGDPSLRRRIDDALGRLSRLQREAFALVHLEGLTVREAAEVLGRSEGTVKTHLHRALRKLRANLGDLREGVTE